MGLESIALAVAHLEEQRSASPPPIPPKKTLGTAAAIVAESSTTTSSSPPRIVSADFTMASSNPSSSADEDEGCYPWNSNTYAKDTKSYPVPSPDEVITQVKRFDVLCGRGGETNHHSGNVWYRNQVKKQQLRYLQAKRRDKPLIARYIVERVRREGGRFLKKDPTTNTWRDVGNNKAREKTSQALREGAPELRVPPSNIASSDDVENKEIRHKREAVEVTPPRKKKRKIVVAKSNEEQHAETSAYPHVAPVSSTDDDETDTSSTVSGSPQQQENNHCRRGPRLRIFKARMSIA